jgi:MoaA/NifB/PqqE/SkfB family radical SAM enzyme
MCDKRGFIDLDLFQRIIKTLPQTVSIGLYWRGEPLLHPKLVQLVKIAVAHGNKCYIVTNAILLTPDKCDMLISAGLRRIVVSLDTLDRQEYKQIRGVDALPMVMSHLDRACDHIDRVEICINCVDYGFNQRGILAIQKMYGARGCTVTILSNSPAIGDRARSGHWVCPVKGDQLYITYRGEVSPCCLDVNCTLLPAIALGGVDWSSLLNSPQYIRWKSAIGHVASLRTYPLCSLCIGKEPHDVSNNIE